MEQSEIIWIASKYVAKGYNFEQMKYGDDLYGRRSMQMRLVNICMS